MCFEKFHFWDVRTWEFSYLTECVWRCKIWDMKSLQSVEIETNKAVNKLNKSLDKRKYLDK